MYKKNTIQMWLAKYQIIFAPKTRESLVQWVIDHVLHLFIIQMIAVDDSQIWIIWQVFS